MADSDNQILDLLRQINEKVDTLGERVEDLEAGGGYTPEQLAAKHRLENDTGVVINVDEGVAPVEVVKVGDGWQASFPKPSDEAKAEWAAQALVVMGNFAPDAARGTLCSVAEAIRAYGVGGPLWLAAFDHDYLMGLPFGMRQRMVQQVHSYSPDAAGELGRDILRRDADDSYAFAQDVLEGRAGHRPE